MSLYQDGVYNVAFRLLGSAESAADVTQETFISAFKHLRSFRGGSLRAWLFRIATNAAYDMMRKMRSRPAESLDAWQDTPGRIESNRSKGPDTRGRSDPRRAFGPGEEGAAHPAGGAACRGSSYRRSRLELRRGRDRDKCIAWNDQISTEQRPKSSAKVPLVPRGTFAGQVPSMIVGIYKHNS